MKKLLSIIMAAAMLALPTTAYAGDYMSYDEGVCEAQTDIHYHAYSTYSVTIPSSLEYGSTEYVSINMSNVETGYYINGYITNFDDEGYISLVNDEDYMGNPTGTVSISINDEVYTPNNDGFIYRFDKSANEDFTYCTISYDFVNKPWNAGNYTGFVCFRFECVNN